MRRLLFVTLIVFAACREHRSPTEPDPTPLPDTVTVAGTIRDYATDAPAAGVTLTIAGRQITTDAAGRYSIIGPRGDYDASFQGQFLGRAIALTSRSDADFRIDGGSCRSRYGALFDSSSGLPIANATVAFGSLTITTGANGAYRLDLTCNNDDRASGTGFIRISHPGYQDTQIAYRAEYLAPPQRVDVVMKRK